MKKILALVLSLVLVLGLFAGCGGEILDGITGGGSSNSSNSADKNSTTAPTGAHNGIEGTTSANITGMLVLNVNAAVNISYDANGNVVEISGADENGEILATEYEGYNGKPCSDVVCELIANSKLAGHMTEEVSYISIKQAVGSTSPTENFLEAIKLDAEAALAEAGSTARLIVLSTDNLDADGWIDLESAKALAMAYLAIDSFDLLEGTDSPIDGLYSFRITSGSYLDEKVLVDALTGSVCPGDLSDVEYNDVWLEDEELTTEPTEDTNAEDPEEQPSEPVQDETIEPTEVTEPETEA